MIKSRYAVLILAFLLSVLFSVGVASASTWEYSEPSFMMADPENPEWTMMTCGHVPYSTIQDTLGIFLSINVTHIDYFPLPLPIETFAIVNYTAPNGSVTQYDLRETNWYWGTGMYPVDLESAVHYQVGTYDIVDGVGGGTCQLIVDPKVVPVHVVSTEYGNGWQKEYYSDGKIHYSNVYTYPLYNGTYSPDVISKIVPRGNDYEIVWNGGALRLKGNVSQPYDEIFNPDTNITLSYWDFWHVWSERQTGKKEWQEEIPVSNTFILIDNSTIKRSMVLGSGGLLNITYHNIGTGIKYDVELTAGYARPYEMRKRTTIPAGQGKLNNNSKHFNLGFYNNLTFWNYQDIPEYSVNRTYNLTTQLWEGDGEYVGGYNTSQWISQSGTEYFQSVTMFGGQIATLSKKDGFDPAWTVGVSGNAWFGNSTLWHLWEDSNGLIKIAGNTSTGVWNTSYDGTEEFLYSLAVYNGNLYAGQGSGTGDGDVLVFNGTSWSTSYNGSQETIRSLAVYNGNLYAGQGDSTGDGDILVFNGTSWSTSGDGGQEGIFSLAVYNGNLYAGQGSGTGDGDVFVFNGISWSTSYNGTEEYLSSLAVYNGNLYAGQGISTGDGDILVFNGTSWSTSYNGSQEVIASLAVYNGNLYAGQGINAGDGNAYIFNQSLYSSGNLTTWYDSGTGNETYQTDVNATTNANSNYTVWYANNGTGSWAQLGGILTGNNSLSISGTKYQNTDIQVRLVGNMTSTPELIAVTFWVEAGGTLYERTAVDSITVIEGAGRTLYSFRGASDSLTIIEGVQRLLSAFRSVSDNLTITDSAARKTRHIRAVQQAITVSENVQSSLIEAGELFIRYVSDTITVTEGAASSWWEGVYYTVSGYVQNILSSPLEKARVEYTGSGGNYSLTNAAGYYSIVVPAGEDRPILSRAIGYRNDTEIIDISGNTEQNFTLNERTSGTVTTPGFGAISGIFIIAVTLLLMRTKKKGRD